MLFFMKIKITHNKVVTNTNEKMDLRTFLRTIFDRGYKSSFLSGFVNCDGFRIPDVSLESIVKVMLFFLFQSLVDCKNYFGDIKYYE